MRPGARTAAWNSFTDGRAMTSGTAILYTGALALMLPLAVAQAQAPVSGQQAPTVEQRLDRVERMLQSQGLLQMLEQLQELQREIRQLRGEIETQNYTLEQLTRRQRDLYTDMDQRLQRLEAAYAGDGPGLGAAGDGSPPLETLSATGGSDEPLSAIPSDSPLQIEIIGTGSAPGGAGQAPGAAGPAAPAPVGTGSTAGMESLADAGAGQAAAGVAETDPMTAPVDPVQLQAEYQQAFNLLRQGLYDQAIRAFQQFLAGHPNDRFSDNAQYWLAEAHYVKREFEQALAEYRKVVENYPQSQKLSDAMLKIGFTLYEMGRPDEARDQLQSLIQRQPDTTVARLAEERIKLINATRQTAPDPGSAARPLP